MSESYIHIYAPTVTRARIRRTQCPTCGMVTPMLQLQYEWFGPDDMCPMCGESWSDHEMRARPFERGWRRDAIRRAIALAQLHGLEVYGA